MQDPDELAHDLIFLGPGPVAVSVCWKDEREVSVSDGKDSTWRYMVVIDCLTALKLFTAQVAKRQESYRPHSPLRIENDAHGFLVRVAPRG
jgi:hypothetical protein